MSNFIGRTQELTLIHNACSSPSASLLIYGKRKVGKTTLIREALKDSPQVTVYYECIKGTLKENIDAFINECVRLNILPTFLSFTSFIDVFRYLSSLNKPMNVILDEYPYLKVLNDSKMIDSCFQSIIDNYIPSIHLFLSGSHIGMMKDLLTERNALYGRFTLTLELKELNYLECADFYPTLPSYDKISFYAVFGGSPFINHFINPQLSLKDNIINTLLNPFSPVYNYADSLLISDFSNTVNAERILYTISNGKKKYNEIENALNLTSNGLLSKQLVLLLNMNLITKTYPINKTDDNKKAFYEINDNLLRFYYVFIYSHKSALTVLGPDSFYKEYIHKSLLTFISHRFETICKTYFSLKAQNGLLPGIKNIGTYYYDDNLSHTHGEFDIALEREISQHKCYDIFEVKYHKDPLSLGEMNQETRQIKAIKGITIHSIGFISIFGFSERNESYILIDGSMLYHISDSFKH